MLAFPSYCMPFHFQDCQVLVLDEGVLLLARRLRRDFIVHDEVTESKANWHAAYRQFILWTCGKLTKGDRRVIPSCCVLKIWDKYPNPLGQFTGFKPDRFA